MNAKLTTFFVLSIHSACRIKAEVTCQKTGPCGCELSNGDGTIDLYPVTKFGDAPLFSGISGDPGSAYSFDPCRKFMCEHSQANVCYSQASITFIPIGNDLSFQYDEESKILAFKYEQEGTSLSTTVTLHCTEEEDGKGVLKSFTNPTDPKSFYTSYDSKYACPVKTKKDHKLSTGSILCILLLVFVFVYVVGGILINKYNRKIEGNLFPNIEFWKDFPSLQKDGCSFVISKISRKKDSEYEKI